MNDGKDILFLSDNPNAGVGADLDLLYPGRVEKRNFVTAACGPETLDAYRYVVTMVCDGKNISCLDYAAVEEYARKGGTVISCLFEYARHRSLTFSKTHVLNRLRPALRIEVEDPITRGYAKGDEVGWYGMVSSAPDQMYANQMLQRQILDVAESAEIRILATSTINGGAVMIHERIGKGEMLALDLLSPLRPFHNSYGSTNKYLFVGNLIGRSVRYGKQYPKRLSYDEFVQAMHETAATYPQLRLEAEGPCSDGRQLWSFGLGDESKPTMYFGAAVHGWEWENAFGLLRLVEVLCENPMLEGMNTADLHFKIMPIQNPAGYDAFTRQDARGVDLNRNFDVAWEDLPVPQDVVVPWDYNYKGPRAASEPETQAIQGIIDRHRPVCVIDYHTADYIMLLPHKGDDALIESIRTNIRARLKDRYVTQKPYNGAYQQVNMDAVAERTLAPYLISYAAERGTPASFLIEMSGNRDDVHALVMNTDSVVEICLAATQECLAWLANTV
jgi:hypothetical protein